MQQCRLRFRRRTRWRRIRWRLRSVSTPRSGDMHTVRRWSESIQSGKVRREKEMRKQQRQAGRRKMQINLLHQSLQEVLRDLLHPWVTGFVFVVFVFVWWRWYAAVLLRTGALSRPGGALKQVRRTGTRKPPEVAVVSERESEREGERICAYVIASRPRRFEKTNNAIEPAPRSSASLARSLALPRSRLAHLGSATQRRAAFFASAVSSGSACWARAHTRATITSKASAGARKFGRTRAMWRVSTAAYSSRCDVRAI